MNKSGLYVGLDVGTTSIKVIVAEKVKGQLNVIGVGNELSSGISNGVIIDIDKASESIRQAVSQAQEKASFEFKDVIVSVPANELKIEPCNGLITIDDQSREITEQDVQNVAVSALGTSLPQEREIIDIQPDEFIVDGFDGIKDPRGMVGIRLEMQGRLITGPKGIMHNLQKAVNKAGLNIAGMVLTPLAESHEILNDGEKDFGTIIIDLGGGQTTASVFHDYQLKYATTDQEGGEFITKDISIVLNTSVKNAEKIKRDYGYADSTQASDQNEFPVEVVGQSEPTYVDEQYLSQIIEARVSQIFDRIKQRLDKISALELPGGIVITGGVSALPGIIDLAAEQFQTNVKLYIPDQMGLRHPSYSAALSLVSYYSDLDDIELIVKSVISATDTADLNLQVVTGDVEAPVSNSKKTKTKKSKGKFLENAKSFLTDFFD